ncbi:MAG: putative Aldose 1-epimerase [Nitrospira sp.]|nr:MAG: putative Aldose 1-epimerase [Nitrospira sp.]
MLYSGPMTNLATPDTELTLSFGNQRAVVSPWGASLRRYFLVEAGGHEVDIVWGYSSGSQKKGGQGDVLIPFPGRVAEGRYVFDGESFQLDRNDKEGPNAIHGFVRTLPWQVSRAEAGSVSFDIRLEAEQFGGKGYPFSLAIRVIYELDEKGLSCSFDVLNAGTRPAPVGVGFHPYFTVGTLSIDDADARIPGAGILEFNDKLTPTGTILSVAGTEWDCRAFRRIGEKKFNHCYVQLDRDAEGMATASLRHAANGRVIDVTMDRAFTAIVVYTGDAIADAPRRAFAIEPMTCASDAFNHPEWGLKRLVPGERFSGRYTIWHRIES